MQSPNIHIHIQYSMFWFVIKLILALKEKEIRRLQAVILKHQVGVSMFSSDVLEIVSANHLSTVS